MRLREYRIVYNAYYNYRAIHNVREHPDIWIVEEQYRITFFGLFKLCEFWRTHKEPEYDSRFDMQFSNPKAAFAYVERLLNGNPRNKILSRIVTEVDHERID